MLLVLPSKQPCLADLWWQPGGGLCDVSCVCLHMLFLHAHKQPSPAAVRPSSTPAPAPSICHQTFYVACRLLLNTYRSPAWWLRTVMNTSSLCTPVAVADQASCSISCRKDSLRMVYTTSRVALHASISHQGATMQQLCTRAATCRMSRTPSGQLLACGMHWQVACKLPSPC